MVRRLWFPLIPAVLTVGVGACGTSETATETGPLCVAATASDPGPSPLRRLTRFEYGRTVHALTGIDASAANALPPDEETLGFDDIAGAYSVSSLHAARYLEVAEEAAAALVADPARLTAIAACDPIGAADSCLTGFIDALGRQAWRRPLDDDERATLRQLYADTADPGPRDGLSGVIAAMLQSPQFLYRPEGTLDGFGLATRLAFLLTGPGPDAALLDAAGAGRLDDDAGLLAEADRLLAGAGAGALFAPITKQWWELQSLPTLDKDRSLYRTWTDGIPGAMAAETRLFLADVWQGRPTLAALLTAPVTFVDSTLASFYGLAPPAAAGFSRVALDPARGAGLLTQGAFLATHAKADQTSPVLRGKFVRTQLLCAPPPPPPPDIVVRPPAIDPRLSTRQRFAQHTADDSCATCHLLMDPIGFAFEHYDAAGRWRDIDGGQTIDATGSLTRTDVDGDLDGVADLAGRLAGSAQVASCVATQWFRYAFGRAEQTSGDLCTIEELASAFGGPGGDFKKMARSTVRMAAFRTPAPETTP
jgi:hypothetical protein